MNRGLPERRSSERWKVFSSFHRAIICFSRSGKLTFWSTFSHICAVRAPGFFQTFLSRHQMDQLVLGRAVNEARGATQIPGYHRALKVSRLGEGLHLLLVP